MKRIILLSLFSLVLTTSSIAQEVFSNSFVGAAPREIVTAGDFLYVSTTGMFSISRVPLASPTVTRTTVSDFGSFIRAMAYKADENTIYATDADGSYYRVDLSLPLPIEGDSFLFSDPARSLLFDGDILYFATTTGFIWSIDVSTPEPEITTIFSETAVGTPPHIAKYNDYIYYTIQDPVPGNSYLARIDISNPSPVEEIVGSNLGASVNSGEQIGNYFYVGLGIFGPNNKLVRFDLTEEEPSPVEVLDVGDDYIWGIASFDDQVLFSLALSDQIIIVDQPFLGSLDLDALDIAVFPNPTSSKFFVQTEVDLSGATYTVYSIDGKEVSRGLLDSTKAIDISRLPVGTYVVRIATDTGMKNLRVIKE